MKYHRDAYCLLFLHCLAYIGLGFLIFNSTLLGWALTFIMFFVYGCLGATVTFHRLLAHRSWRSPRWFYIFGTIAGTLSMIGSSLAWVSLHYDHHKHTDKQQDPHSPKYNLLSAYLGGMFVEPNMRRVTHLLRDPLHIFLHKYYTAIHISLLCLLMLINPFLAVSLYLAPVALVLIFGGAVNLFCHKYGYKNFDTDDLSKNNLILGYCMWGEGWHNNHHANPANSYLGRKWWELDISGLIIKILRSK